MNIKDLNFDNKDKIMKNVKDITKINENEFEEILKNNKNIKYVYDIVKSHSEKEDSAYREDFFESHIIPCTKIAYFLAKKQGLNVENAVICGLLHDIARKNIDTCNKHEVHGSKEAIDILNKIGYPKSDIYIISNSILKHKVGSRENINAEISISADSDALSYMQEIDYFYIYLINNGFTKKEAIKNVNDKIQDCYFKMSDFTKRLIIPKK